MKDSIIVVGFFALGIAIGYSGWLPADIDFAKLAVWVLYLLVAVIGFDFGYRNLVPTLKSMTASSLLLPLFTVAGTLGFTVLAALFLSPWGMGDYLAVGSGFGYYSLSSVLIVDCKKAEFGIEAATRLGTLAILTNLLREMLSLVCARGFRRWFGPYAPVSAAGVTSIDVALPVIVKVCGNEAVPIAVAHGVFLEMFVPILVLLFCAT